MMFHSFSHQHLFKADNTCYFANGQSKLQNKQCLGSAIKYYSYFQRFLLTGNNNTLENDILRHELDVLTVAVI
ncbi:hypothetical protein ACJX0J_006173, partial [Zea mays]